MDERSVSEEKAEKPFKTPESENPELVTGSSDSSSSNCAIAVVSAPQSPEPQNNQPNISKTARDPHPNSISNLVKAKPAFAAKSGSNTNTPIKTPMTPRRFMSFVCGLFLAAMMGNFSNSLFSFGIERAFPPQYVKDFEAARALPEQDRAFSGMHAALTKGQAVEFLSRRYTHLTTMLAHDLDLAGRHLEAKTEWAKAATPNPVASPDFRERKRSYITSEGMSEHMAIAAGQKKSADLDLIEEIEDAAYIFQKSEVIMHNRRAYEAYLTAGNLHADNGDYARAIENFDRAEMIANAQWIEGGPANFDLNSARWRAELHELIQALPASASPVKSVKYAPGFLNASLTSQFEQSFLKKDWRALDNILSQVEKSNVKDRYGVPIAAEFYRRVVASWHDLYKDEAHRKLLKQWIDDTSSSRSWLVAAYLNNYEASSLNPGEYSSDRGNVQAMEHLRKGVEALHHALLVEPQMAVDPAFINAVQNNFEIGLTVDNSQVDLANDLVKSVTALHLDEGQLFLQELSYRANHFRLTESAKSEYMSRATKIADRIGGADGDEFYAQAVAVVFPGTPLVGVDEARTQRGKSLIAREFGTGKRAIGNNASIPTQPIKAP